MVRTGRANRPAGGAKVVLTLSGRLRQMTEFEVPAGIDTRTPNAARMYDYYLGGKDNFEVDRATAETVLKILPEIAEAARQGRALINRVVRYLVAEQGIRQILDIGSGLPTQDNVHEIAHRIDPSTKVVYVDHDPMVLAHGRALLAGGTNVRVVQAELTRPADVLGDAQVREQIDFDQPVAVLMMYVLHLVGDAQRPQEALARYREALAPGSFLVISHASNETRAGLMGRISAIYTRANSPFVPRSRDEIAEFFGDFEMQGPGLVNIWPFPQPPDSVDPELAASGYSGVGRKSGQRQ
jgi:SAM-dependent methyltransferase